MTTNEKHGLHGVPEYWVWHRAKDRCKNPNNPKFKHYGGRGIKMCQEWRDSFAAFIASMGRRPAGRYTLDRIDNNGDYEPGNCRWATYAAQNRNNRRTRLLTFQGKTHCITDWADILGMSRATLYGRIYRGWSTEKALTAPLHSRRQSRLLTFQGETRSLTSWAKKLKINITTLLGRLSHGWSVERTLTAPLYSRREK
jgi:hypothetical protein